MTPMLRRWAKRLADPWLDRIAVRVAHRLPAPAVAPPAAAPAPPQTAAPLPTDAALDFGIAWDLKLFGSRLARELFDARVQPLLDAPPAAPRTVPLTSKLCEQADIESAWFVHWCRELKMAPIYHRKVWEDCFALQAMWEAGVLREGSQGLCFGAGAEPLPSYLASRGVDVLATDLAPDDAAAAQWMETGQHASPDRLFRPELVDRATFDRRISFRHVDMNDIPDDLAGRFDVCWSLCSLEHVGSTAQALAFIERSLDCLKPGGFAVHTTEYNLSSETDTLTTGACVIFTRPQIEALCDRLRAAGHEVFPVSFHTGSQPLDRFIDLPPWLSPNALSPSDPPHLRLALAGYAVTSIALLLRRGA